MAVSVDLNGKGAGPALCHYSHSANRGIAISNSDNILTNNSFISLPSFGGSVLQATRISHIYTARPRHSYHRSNYIVESQVVLPRCIHEKTCHHSAREQIFSTFTVTRS